MDVNSSTQPINKSYRHVLVFQQVLIHLLSFSVNREVI